MSKLCLIARLVVTFTLLHATPYAIAEDHQTCAKRDLVVQRLQEKFGETQRGIGLNQTDGLLEIFTSPATGTWTILMTKPDGSTCLLAAGRRWAEAHQKIALPGKEI